MSTLEGNRSKVWPAVLLAALVALLALPAVSQEAAEAPAVATMRTAPGSVSWAPLVSYDKLVLTVSGGGFTATREFTGGGVHFAAVDPEGYQLPDGTYSWEITVIPPALGLNKTLIRSDERWDNGRSQRVGTAPEALVQSGSFTIADGAVVDPSPIEPDSAEPRPGIRAAEAADIDDSDQANQ
jgi:hypothetical protein